MEVISIFRATELCMLHHRPLDGGLSQARFRCFLKRLALDKAHCLLEGRHDLVERTFALAFTMDQYALVSHGCPAASSRNLNVATVPSTRKSTSATNCVSLKRGSVW